MPPTFEPSTGRPRSCASITTRPIPSERDGRISAAASSSTRTISSVDSSGCHVASPSRTSVATTSVRVPLPTIRSSAFGRWLRHASARPSMFL